MRLLNNKRLVRRIILATAAVGIGIPATVIVVKQATSYTTNRIGELFTPNAVTFEIRNISNQDVSQAIMLFITKRTTQDSLLHFNADQFFEALKKRFAVIKKVELHLKPPKTLHLTIVGHTPCARINDQLVLGDDNQVLAESFFDEQTLRALPTITVNPRLIKKQTISKRVATFIHAITADQWATYAITYHAPWRIDAVPYKSICKCRLITDEKSFFEEYKFTAMSSIFRDLCTDGLISKKMLQTKGIPIGFDLRIKNQIIVQFYEQIRRGGV
jgi:hypothetical protein